MFVKENLDRKKKTSLRDTRILRNHQITANLCPLGERLVGRGNLTIITAKSANMS